ncbi:hypothetical protein C2E23DRAFT_807288 [Lenzites betulinus]|nr:hypothetical protein C2E23DRAFT_807288 [Lenzites betulinus]
MVVRGQGGMVRLSLSLRSMVVTLGVHIPDGVRALTRLPCTLYSTPEGSSHSKYDCHTSWDPFIGTTTSRRSE